MDQQPRIVIAGTYSGCGKTTVSTGLMSAFTRKGLRVQGFKAGPDYIDPMFHKMATGKPSRNLDTWMLSKSAVCQIFVNSRSDIAVIEGVMGLFDGATSAGEIGSTAHLAKLLEAPVILVVDAKSIGRSIAALVKGYHEFDKKLCVAGVILNRVSGERHFELLKEALKGYRVLGYLPMDSQLKLPERHLGLVPAQELPQMRTWLAALEAAITKNVDIDMVLKIARTAQKLGATPSQTRAVKPRAHIALARDAAFNFYYEDNLELLKAEGAELIEFSPLVDSQIPKEAAAVIFGGGFPEVFADQLARNESMRTSLKAAANRGLPIYAECGGLMYLVNELVDSEGSSHQMAGIIPGRINMTSRLQNFGYCVVEAARDTFLFRKGERFRGHEFHYSVWDMEGQSKHSVFRIHRNKSARLEGFCQSSLHASYIHLHWRAARQIPRRLVQAAVNYKKKGKKGDRFLFSQFEKRSLSLFKSYKKEVMKYVSTLRYRK